MVDADQVAGIVEELIDVLHLQARELEKLISHIEQVTAHLPEASEISVVRSELSALHIRLKKLRQAPSPPEG